jgi:thiamine biosynthesis lipoprotein
VVDLAGETMGTTWHLRLAAPAGLDTGALQRAVQGRLDGLVLQMSHWRADSLLCGYNRAPAGTSAVLPPDFAAVMRAGLDIAARSDGAFDPTLGTLVDLWGFGPTPIQKPFALSLSKGRPSSPKEQDNASTGAAQTDENPAPSPEVIEQARAHSGWQRATFDPATARLHQPGNLRLDLSGIAKGYAVDAITALLHTHGIRHCLVEIGGELSGRGLKPDGEPWWVEFENPAPDALPPFRVALHQLAIATSGDYVRGAHNIDGRTGHPAAHGIASVSVLHPSAMHADAWASALTVLGAVDGLALADRERLPARIVVRSGAGWIEHLSPALQAML